MSRRPVSIFRTVPAVLLLLAVVFSFVRTSQAQNLAFTPGIASTYAGDTTGTQSESAATFTGLPSALVMNVPISMVYDSSGNFYIAENRGNIIRVVAAGTTPIPTLPGVTPVAGHVYTLAGGATANCAAATDAAGDGCPATSIALTAPGNMAIDAHGNIFFLDSTDQEMRVIYAAGTIPQLASAGTNAPVAGNVYNVYPFGNSSAPTTVAVDAQENIYIDGTNTAPKVLYSGTTSSGNPLGIPTTTAVGGVVALGSSTASCTGAACIPAGPLASVSLNRGAIGISVDSSGNIYLADSSDSLVRVIYVAGAIPGILDPLPGYVYTIAGTGVAPTAANGVVPALGTAATSQPMTLKGPVVFDAAGNLYFVDDVRLSLGYALKVDASGLLTNVFGGLTYSGSASAPFPTACTTKTDIWGDGCLSNAAGLLNPTAVAVDSSGNVYVSDFNENLIRKSTIASTALSANGTVGIAAAGGTVIVSNVGATALGLSGFNFTGPFAQAATGGTSDCTATITLAPAKSCLLGVTPTASAPGTYMGTLAIASNSLNATDGVNTVALSGTVVPATTTTSLAASPTFPTTVNSGQQVTFTATVTPQAGDTLVPSGTVTLLNGATTVGTGTLNNGSVTIPVTTLPSGTLAITASFAASSTFGASTSAAVTVVVSPTAAPVANVALASSVPSAMSGQSVTLTATVTTPAGAAVPSGTVTFQDGVNPLGTAVAVNGSGVATFTTTTLPAGPNTLMAVFNGTAGYAANDSNRVSVVITSGAQLALTPGIVTRIAGSTSTGSTGDGAPASTAFLNTVWGTATDPAGNIYIADYLNSKIRVVASGKALPGIANPVAGNIYTFAGGGTCATPACNNGVAATTAMLSGPSAVTTDAFGNVYIADSAAIRKIDTSGIITTLAGVLQTYGYNGNDIPATTALLTPVGVAVDNSGNIYIADGGTPSNQLVRRVDALTGIITLVAGTQGVACSAVPCGDGGPATSAKLSLPNSVALDFAGNVYIADYNDDAIRKVDARTGIISTVAGVIKANTNGSFSGDGGPATSAGLYWPNTVSVDNGGNLYIGDSVNGRIREVNAQTGIISTIAGGGICTPGPCGSGGLATSAVFVQYKFNSSLDWNGNLTMGDAAEVFSLPVTSVAANFGNQDLGTSNTQTFTLTNIGAGSLSLTDISAATTSTPAPTPGDFSQIASGGADCTASMTLSSGLSCMIGAQWYPTVAIAETGTITIASNATNATAGNNLISISGTGLASNGTTAQTITFPALSPSYKYGAAISLGATSDSGLAVSYRVSGPATLSGTTLTLTGVGNVTVSAYQFGNSQYGTATPQSRSFSVTQAPLTVTAMEAPVTVGNPITAPTFAITGFVGSDTQASVVTGSPVLTITNTQTGAVVPAGSVQPSGSYTVTITQGTLSAGPNYALNFVNATFSVTGTESQTITFTALANATYGVGPITLNAVSTDAITKANTGLPITFTVNAPNTIAGNLLTVVAAGAVAVTATQPGNATYQEASQTVSFTVAPAPLTVTAGNLTAAQNSTLPIFTNDYSFSGFVNGDTQAAVTGTPMLSTTAADTSALGTFPINITQGSLSSANYTFKTFVPGTLTVIVGTAQTISFPAIPNVVYGSAPITLSAKASSGLGVSYAVTGGSAIIAGNALSITGAGSVTVVASQPGSGSYTTATPVSQTFAVAPAVLALTANNVTRLNSTVNPTFTATLSGFVNGDTAASATSGTPSFTTTAVPSSPVGTYPIIPSAQVGALITLKAANYTFMPVNGTLTITSGGPVAGFSLTATPQQLNISAGGSIQSSITLTPQNYYQSLVTLSCGNLPANVQCVFTPATVSPDGTGSVQTTTVTLVTNSATAVIGKLDQRNGTQTQAAKILYLPALLTGLLLLFHRKRLMKSGKIQQLLVLTVLFAGLMGLAACGASTNSASSQTAVPGTYSVTVTAKGQDGATNAVPVSLRVF